MMHFLRAGAATCLALLLTLLPSCSVKDATEPAPAPNTTTRFEATNQAAVITAQSWYRRTTARTRSISMDWAQARTSGEWVVAPLTNKFNLFASQHKSGYRFLVTHNTATGAGEGRIVEVVAAEAYPSERAAQVALDAARSLVAGQKPIGIANFTGWAMVYSADYVYQKGLVYEAGVLQPQSVRIQVESVLKSKQDHPALSRISSSPVTTNLYQQPVCYTVTTCGEVNGVPAGCVTDRYCVDIDDGGGGSGGTGGDGGDGGGWGGGGNTGNPPPQVIKDQSITNNEKANCIYEKLSNNSSFQNLLSAFQNTTKYNVQFTLGDAGNNTGITHWNANTHTAEITISADALSYQHAIWVASTFFHEAFHANLQQHAIETFGSFEISTWPKPIDNMTLQELVSCIDISAAKNQSWQIASHDFMAYNTSLMADGLRSFVQNNYPSTFAQIGNNQDAYKALSLMGLQDSKLWKTLTVDEQSRYSKLMGDFITSELPDCTK